MQFSAAQIASLIQGRVAGDPDVQVRNVAKIEEAGPGDLSFIADARYLDFLSGSRASVIIISESLFDGNGAVGAAQIVVPNARGAFAVLLEQYNNMMSGQGRRGIEQPSYVHESARLADEVYVGAFAYISAGAVLGKGVKVYPNSYIGADVEVGEGSVLHPGVRIYDGCRIGARVVIHAGTVIGADGFGFAPQADGSYKKIPQIGNVVIEDDVEIGSNTTIDRATMGSTVIRRGVKLDNLIQIAHNVELGEHTAIAAQTGIAGSTKVGRHCIIGGQVGMIGHIAIADRVSINAQSGIGGNITEEGAKLTGSPAADYRASLKSQVIFRNLPAIEGRLREAEKKLEELNRLLSEKTRTHEVAGEDTGHGG